ncbi:MAG: hypothetical protein RLZZ597_293, partial [Cyanobacteriota bacterium]
MFVSGHLGAWFSASTAAYAQAAPVLVRNQAQASYVPSGGGVPVVLPQAVTTVPVVWPPAAAPQLQIVKTSNRASAAPGDVVNYQVVVTNPSAVGANSVTVTDQLPVGFAYVANSVQATPNALTQTVNPANRTLTLTFGALPAGGAITVNYGVQVTADAVNGDGRNTAQATAPGVPPVTAAAQVTLVPVPNPPPQLQIVKTSNRASAAPGDVVNYQVVVTNPSAVGANSVTVTDQLPVGFAYVANSVQATPNALTQTINPANRTLTLTFG